MSSSPPLAAAAQALHGGLCTQVLVSLRLRQDADVAQAMSIMREEMIATAQLYMKGKIQQWYSQLDERGVLFFFNGSDVDEVQTLMSSLPLVTAELVDLQYTRLGPLVPLQSLLS